MRKTVVHPTTINPNVSLSIGRKPAIPEEKRSEERVHHKRMISLTCKPRSTFRTIQSPSDNDNNVLFKRYCRDSICDKTAPLISPKVPMMRSLILAEIYSKPLCKTISHQQPVKTLRQTTIIKAGNTGEENMRRGSTGCVARRMQRILCPSTTRTKPPIQKHEKKVPEAAQVSLQEGIEKLKKNDLNNSIDCFDRALALKPKNNPDAYYHRGIALLKAGMAPRALKVYLYSLFIISFLIGFSESDRRIPKIQQIRISVSLENLYAAV